MKRPELKQFGNLTGADFERHPVWIGSHTADCDEPWYDDTDEETFRPRDGDLPSDRSEGMLLVRAAATLRDGSRFSGFVTPAFEKGDLGTMQPHVFVNGRMFAFWGGTLGISREGRAAFYTAVGRPAGAVFPIRFAAEPGLTAGVSSVEVDGFYKVSGDTTEAER